MTAAVLCRACGAEPRSGARFCDSCGAPIAASIQAAEYKQVTVLFADVVHSMDIASAVGAERLREIMAELLDVSVAVIQRYGGTVDKFTGDGIMAVFGAPAALEDHAFRACLAALDIQKQTQRLATDVQRSDNMKFQLRVGLNSGQVIAGEIGSIAAGYTAIGEQVGMAQRMESAASPGAVMLSESTARLVEHLTTLGDLEGVQIKGAEHPVPARRLLSISAADRTGRQDPTLVGRRWELNALKGILDESIHGAGSVVGVVGPPGIGKSRIVRELAAIAKGRSVDVFTTHCESHTTDIPFHAVSRLLRGAYGVNDIDDAAGRKKVRDRIGDADPADIALLDDLLGIRDSTVDLPDISPDARRRRLANLVKSASLARPARGVYVIEDVHWIDEVSESILADLLTVVAQTPSMVLVTYRPEYRGGLGRTANAQTIALTPLNDSQTSALISELLGPDRSVAGLGVRIAQRAAGNPFFVQEIVRDLAERKILEGDRGGYTCRSDVVDADVPATLQATIAARIDRLDDAAKRTLSAAAVIGSNFDTGLIATLVDDAALAELVEAELVDQVMFTPRAEYAFHHPLIRTVAYESQLKSDRAESHRRLAAAIEQRDPGAAEQYAALIAEHLEAAGDLRAAFGWHMRAGNWSAARDSYAARMSWQRAREVADRLPADDPERPSMRIAPRTQLCASSWRVVASAADTDFDELRELCIKSGDQVSLALGLAGQVTTVHMHGEINRAVLLGTELVALLESIGDPTLDVGLLLPAINVDWTTGRVVDAMRLAQRVIDLAEGDSTKGNLMLPSPLAQALGVRALAGCFLGRPDWKLDFRRAEEVDRLFDPSTRALTSLFKSAVVAEGALKPDAATLQHSAEVLRMAEQSSDEIALALARQAHGTFLVYSDLPGDATREEGLELLATIRLAAEQQRYSADSIMIVDMLTAKEKARTGDTDRAIELARTAVETHFESGEMFLRGSVMSILVEALLERRAGSDLQEAEAAIERLAAVPTDPGFVPHALPLLRLRALLARARGDGAGYCVFRERYRQMANDVGYEGHIALAEAMT